MGRRGGYGILAVSIIRTVDGVEITHDVHGRPSTVAIPGQGTRSWTYSQQQWNATDLRWEPTTPSDDGGMTPGGLPITVAEPVPDGFATSAGHTVNTYDSAGNLITSTSPTGAVTTNTYDQLGRLTETTVTGADIDTATTSYVHDELGNVITESRPVTINAVTEAPHQLTVTTVYDEMSRVESVTQSDSGGDSPDRHVVYTYDPLGRVATETVRVDASRTAVTAHTYDLAGNPIRTVDPMGTVITRVFDDAGRQLEEWIENHIDPNVGGAPVRFRLSKSIWDSETGQLWYSLDALNRVTRYDYDEAGNRVRTVRLGASASGGAHVVEELTFDLAGQVTSRVTAGGQVRTDYTYDLAGRLIEEIFDPDGLNRVISYDHDDLGNQTVRRLTDGSDGGAVLVEETRWSYDARGLLSSETVENGPVDLVTSFTVDVLGRNVSVTLPGGAVADTVFDASGRIVELREAPVAVDGDAGEMGRPTTTFGYDAFGQRTHTRGPNGHVTVDEFNAAGWPVRSTRPTYVRPTDGQALVATTETEFDLIGRAVSTTAPDGGAELSAYDSLGRLVRTTTPSASGGDVVETWRHDNSGRVVEQVSATGAVSIMAYDALDRMTSVSVQVAASAMSPARIDTHTYTYDDAGNMVRSVDPAGGVMTVVHNAAGEEVEVVSPWQNLLGTQIPVRIEHDAAGREVLRTDETGASTASVFDLAGRAVRRGHHDPGVGAWVWHDTGYDAAGNVISETDPIGAAGGWSRTYTYDSSSRLTQVTEPTSDGQAVVTSFGYDLGGNRTLMVDGRGNATTYSYNAWDLLESTVEPATAATPSVAERIYSVAYDVMGREISRSDPDGTTVTSAYDPAGNLISEVGTSDDPQVPGASRQVRHDDAGRVIAVGPPGAEATLAYDQMGDLTAQTDAHGSATWTRGAGGVVIERADSRGVAVHDWNAAGLLESMIDPVSGRHIDLGYDARGQLIESVADTEGFVPGAGHGDRQQTTWLLDGTGRTTSTVVTDAAGALRYREDLDHDQVGRVIARRVSTNATADTGPGSGEFVYDRAGRLIEIDAPDEAPLQVGWDPAGNRTSVGPVSYLYDERNRLLSSSDGIQIDWSPAGHQRTRTVGAAAHTQTRDALGRTIADGDTTYTWDDLNRLSERTDTTSTQPFRYEGTRWDPVSVGGHRRGTHPDGSTVGLDDRATVLNAHGDLVATISPTAQLTVTGYDPFGAPTTATDHPFGFQADYTDPATSQVWMGARHYDPALGAFTSRDSWAGRPTEPITLNRFTYGNADPLNHVDLDGHQATPQQLTLIGLTMGSAAAVAFAAQAGIAGTMALFSETLLPPLNAASRVASKSSGGLLVFAWVMAAAATLLAMVLLAKQAPLLPSIRLPELTLPDIDVPEVSLPQVLSPGAAVLAPHLKPTLEELGLAAAGVIAATATEIIRQVDRLPDCQSVAGVVGSHWKITILRRAARGDCQSHHIVQHAAVRNVKGYGRGSAPAILIKGRANVIGSQHYLATRAQDDAMQCRTLGAEKRVASDALEQAGFSPAAIVAARLLVVEYFNGRLLLTDDAGAEKGIRKPATRRNCP